jgi:acyl-CoA reductase-like NAD-dependent aldehyde dehydrogenase
LGGKHLIAGQQWVAGAATFQSSPAFGEALTFSVGTPANVSAAATVAEEAFPSYCALKRDARATFLDMIAEEIEARGAEIRAIGTSETGLPAARLEGERGRTTTGQLRGREAQKRASGSRARSLDREGEAGVRSRSQWQSAFRSVRKPERFTQPFELRSLVHPPHWKACCV